MKGILKSRTKAPLSQNIDDLSYLATSHYLIGSNINFIRDNDVNVGNMVGLLRNWAKAQRTALRSLWGTSRFSLFIARCAYAALKNKAGNQKFQNTCRKSITVTSELCLIAEERFEILVKHFSIFRFLLLFICVYAALENKTLLENQKSENVNIY